MKTSVVVAALLLSVSAYAKDSSVVAPVKINVEAIQASLSELPAVEIPVKAGELMKAASKEAKIETAKAILKSVLEQRPQMAIQLVASLVKAAPETASQVATLGATIVPQFATQIIKVAAATAPAFAKDIALASATAFPSQQENIVQLVSSVVPSARAEISSAVSQRSDLMRLISDALGQGVSGGTVTTFSESISQIRAASPRKLSELASAIANGLGGGKTVRVDVNPSGELVITVTNEDGTADLDNSQSINISVFPNDTIIHVGQAGSDPGRITYTN